METQFCLDALDEALQRYGKPEIFNSDQGSQFTSNEFTAKLKYEEVYLKAYETPKEAELEISNYIVFYNEQRYHQSLDTLTPDQVYFARQIFTE